MGYCRILPALVFRTTVTEGSGSVWVVRLDIAQNFCLTQFATIFPDGVFPGPVTTKARHFALLPVQTKTAGLINQPAVFVESATVTLRLPECMGQAAP